MADLIQLRNGTAAEWVSTNPILAQSEPGVENDTLRQKIGNGVDDWMTLPYYTLGGLYVAIAGDTMTGQLKGIAPVDDVDLTRKDYVDGLAGKAVQKLGDTMSGSLDLPDAVLLALDEEINANTVVDVFVYDTSLDDDGGAWTKQTSGTSWYNETLNTATRGSTRNFPAVAVIVTEALKITIYDATDNTLPMWMVFVGGGKSLIIQNTSYTIGTAKMLNGVMYTHSVFGGNYVLQATKIDFKSELCFGYTHTPSYYTAFPDSCGEFRKGLANRNVTLAFQGASTLNPTTINNTVNDLAITSTGNMETIVAFAEEQGCSVIHPDGTVAYIRNHATANITKHCNFSKSGSLYLYVNSTKDSLRYDTYSTDKNIGEYDAIYNEEVAPYIYLTNSGLITEYFNVLPGNDVYISKVETDGLRGLCILKEDYVDSTNGMVAYIDVNRNTGYMHGDIKGCFLANSATADRSVNSIDLTMTGTVDENPVATGAELMAYSRTVVADYVEQGSNSGLDFGTDDFYVTMWLYYTGGDDGLFYYGPKTGTTWGSNYWIIRTEDSAQAQFKFVIDYGELRAIFSPNSSLALNAWSHLVVTRVSGKISLYINGVLVTATDIPIDSISGGTALIGGYYNTLFGNAQKLSLLKIGAGAPTAKQIAEIYEAELPLFQENAKCLFQGAGSSIKVLSYDPITDNLNVCTTSDKSVFNGLIRASGEAVAYTSHSEVNSTEVGGN